jgi:hypothetical protein
MLANGLHPSFRAEIDEPMQIPESRGGRAGQDDRKLELPTAKVQSAKTK